MLGRITRRQNIKVKSNVGQTHTFASLKQKKQFAELKQAIDQFLTKINDKKEAKDLQSKIESKEVEGLQSHIEKKFESKESEVIKSLDGLKKFQKKFKDVKQSEKAIIYEDLYKKSMFTPKTLTDIAKTTSNFKKQIKTCKNKEKKLKEEIEKGFKDLKQEKNSEDIKLKIQIKSKLKLLKTLTKQRFNANKNLLSIKIQEKETLQIKLSKKYIKLKSQHQSIFGGVFKPNQKQIKELKEKITTLESELNDLNNQVEESEKELSRIEKTLTSNIENVQKDNYKNISLELKTQQVDNEVIETEEIKLELNTKEASQEPVDTSKTKKDFDEFDEKVKGFSKKSDGLVTLIKKKKETLKKKITKYKNKTENPKEKPLLSELVLLRKEVIQLMEQEKFEKTIIEPLQDMAIEHDSYYEDLETIMTAISNDSITEEIFELAKNTHSKLKQKDQEKLTSLMLYLEISQQTDIATQTKHELTTELLTASLSKEFTLHEAEVQNVTINRQEHLLKEYQEKKNKTVKPAKYKKIHRKALHASQKKIFGGKLNYLKKLISASKSPFSFLRHIATTREAFGTYNKKPLKIIDIKLEGDSIKVTIDKSVRNFFGTIKTQETQEITISDSKTNNGDELKLLFGEKTVPDSVKKEYIENMKKLLLAPDDVNLEYSEKEPRISYKRTIKNTLKLLAKAGSGEDNLIDVDTTQLQENTKEIAVLLKNIAAKKVQAAGRRAGYAGARLITNVFSPIDFGAIADIGTGLMDAAGAIVENAASQSLTRLEAWGQDGLGKINELNEELKALLNVDFDISTPEELALIQENIEQYKDDFNRQVNSLNKQIEDIEEKIQTATEEVKQEYIKVKERLQEIHTQVSDVYEKLIQAEQEIPKDVPSTGVTVDVNEEKLINRTGLNSSQLAELLGFDLNNIDLNMDFDAKFDAAINLKLRKFILLKPYFWFVDLTSGRYKSVVKNFLKIQENLATIQARIDGLNTNFSFLKKFTPKILLLNNSDLIGNINHELREDSWNKDVTLSDYNRNGNKTVVNEDGRIGINIIKKSFIEKYTGIKIPPIFSDKSNSPGLRKFLKYGPPLTTVLSGLVGAAYTVVAANTPVIVIGGAVLASGPIGWAIVAGGALLGFGAYCYLSRNTDGSKGLFGTGFNLTGSSRGTVYLPQENPTNEREFKKLLSVMQFMPESTIKEFGKNILGRTDFSKDDIKQLEWNNEKTKFHKNNYSEWQTQLASDWGVSVQESIKTKGFKVLDALRAKKIEEQSTAITNREKLDQLISDIDINKHGDEATKDLHILIYTALTADPSLSSNEDNIKTIAKILSSYEDSGKKIKTIERKELTGISIKKRLNEVSKSINQIFANIPLENELQKILLDPGKQQTLINSITSECKKYSDQALANQKKVINKIKELIRKNTDYQNNPIRLYNAMSQIADEDMKLSMGEQAYFNSLYDSAIKELSRIQKSFHIPTAKINSNYEAKLKSSKEFSEIISASAALLTNQVLNPDNVSFQNCNLKIGSKEYLVAELMIKIQFGEDKKQAYEDFIKSYNKVTKSEELKMDSAKTDAELAQKGIELAQIDAELAQIIGNDQEIGRLLTDIKSIKTTPNKDIEEKLLASLKMSSSIKPKNLGESTVNKYLLPLFEKVSEKDKIDDRTLNTFFFRCCESSSFKKSDWNTYIIKLSKRIDEMEDDETKTKCKNALRKLIDQARTLPADTSLPPELKNQERSIKDFFISQYGYVFNRYITRLEDNDIEHQDIKQRSIFGQKIRANKSIFGQNIGAKGSTSQAAIQLIGLLDNDQMNDIEKMMTASKLIYQYEIKSTKQADEFRGALLSKLTKDQKQKLKTLFTPPTTNLVDPQLTP